MKCRIDIKGRKIWVDNDNAYDTRPESTEIILYRDEVEHKTVALDSDGDGKYIFKCLPVYNKYTGLKYSYTMDERVVPDDYVKTITGYNITNTLDTFTINGTKTWDDNDDAEGHRPADITIRLLQNGLEIDSLPIPSPVPPEDTANYTFAAVPYADAQGVPYVYTLTEDPVENYTATVSGFNITNRLFIVPFTFTKKCVRSQMSLQGAEFELRQSGALKGTATSDSAGLVSFSIGAAGTFQMTETQPPVGYMSNVTVYEVIVASDGTVTIDGQPAAGFAINNQPIARRLDLSRATSTVSEYMAAPNTWALHGSNPPDLFMVDKIIVTPEEAPVAVKWDYGVKTVAYFASGGGQDITGSYANGIPVETNGDYTVYVRFANNYETVATIKIDRIRDGSQTMPFLLIDYSTALALEPDVTGIGQFVLDYMQGGGAKLSQNYEIYENIDMVGKLWDPLGAVTSPYTVSDGFRGTLYGNGNDIIGLINKVTRADTFAALFKGVSDGALIENLGIINSDIGGVYYPAGFAGCINVNGGTVTLKDLRFNGSVTGTNYTGSMVAYANIDGGLLDISGCDVDAVVKGASGVGGIIGICFLQSAGMVTIDGCSTAGSVSNNTTANTGGIAGNINSKGGSGAITNCINAMAVSGIREAGGILGVVIAQAAIELKISSCCNKGAITANYDVGGIAGTLGSSSYPSSLITMENCYNSGAVTAIGRTGGATCAGLAARLYSGASVKNSYNVCDVLSVFADPSTSFYYAGGISAYYGVVSNCASIGGTVINLKDTAARISAYSVASSTLNNNVAFDNMQVLINGVPKWPLDIGPSGKDGVSVTAAQIKAQGLYENTLGWDFTDIWTFGNGAYTLPVLQGIPLSLQPDTLPSHLV